MAAKRRGQIRPQGQLRQSQVVTTFGPGAMVDLPEHSVIIGGLDNWTGHRDRQIFEDRLANKIKTLLNVSSIDFFAPPADRDDPTAEVTGITAWQFPAWFIAQYEVRQEGSPVRSRPLVPMADLVKGQYVWDKKKYKVVPIRFVQACTRGHVSDIDWRRFVHKGELCTRSLWIDERGTSGDIFDITIRCECGMSQLLAPATKPDGQLLGSCKGNRPWLGNYGREQCGGADGRAMNRLLVRSASNAYFAQTMSAISIPEPGGAVRTAVDAVWQDFLQYAESIAAVTNERRKQKVSAAIDGLTDAEVWKEVERRRAGTPVAARGIRDAEVETLLTAKDEIGQERPDGDAFYARSVAIRATSGPMRHLSRVVKVHRLREVIAQIGFTRFEAAVADVNGELELGVQRAQLSIDETWLPAIENRGEGVFLGVKADAIASWLARAAVKEREKQLRAGFDAWRLQHAAGSSATFIGLPYVMLHTLSHLLITTVSLDCGYAASSIRERVYATPAGFGILLYTASPDAEGTLGGLVETADRLDFYLQQALAMGELCSNDPVCAQHRPDSAEEERYLLGAACHGCVLLPESSCERRNEYMDRALVVPTVDGEGAAFFDEG